MKYSGIPQLKLKFNIIQTTPINPEKVIGLLVEKLKRKEYEILEETNDSLTFFNSPWKLRWTFQRYIAMDGGKVGVALLNNSTSISFNYYLDLFPFLLCACFMVFVISSRDYDIMVFFGCFYFIAFAISVIRAKWEAKNILKEALNDPLSP